MLHAYSVSIIVNPLIGIFNIFVQCFFWTHKYHPSPDQHHLFAHLDPGIFYPFLFSELLMICKNWWKPLVISNFQVRFSIWVLNAILTLTGSGFWTTPDCSFGGMIRDIICWIILNLVQTVAGFLFGLVFIQSLPIPTSLCYHHHAYNTLCLQVDDQC